MSQSSLPTSLPTSHTAPRMSPGITGPSRAQLVAYILAILAAFAITLASVGAAHAAVVDALTIELRQASVPYTPPDIGGDDDLGNQPLSSDDTPDND